MDNQTGTPTRVETGDAAKVAVTAVCWGGAAAIAYFTHDAVAAVIALACAYYFAKLVWSGSTDS